MSKSAGIKASTGADMSQFCKSTFTLTFAVEILGIDTWQDCNSGWQDLGPYVQGMKIQYQLHPGQMYDLDILIWPHAAKVRILSRHLPTYSCSERGFLLSSLTYFHLQSLALSPPTSQLSPEVAIEKIVFPVCCYCGGNEPSVLIGRCSL